MAETPGSTLQRLAAGTGGVVTPANLLDVVALVGAWWAGPRLGSWKGYAVGAPSYFADLADGIIARRTGTVTRVGEIMDHVVGDKPKIFWGAWHIWRLRLADRPLIATVAVSTWPTPWSPAMTCSAMLSPGCSRTAVQSGR